MDEEQAIRIESGIQALLVGKLGQAETAELLARITEDDNAREILADMIALQRQSRQAYNCDVEDEVIQAALARTLDALKAFGVRRSETSDGATVPAVHRRRKRNLRVLAWPVRIAAIVLIGVCVYVAVVARQDREVLRNQLARMEEYVALPKPTAGELAGFRQVWFQVAESSESTRPWVFLSDGRGEFGYVPVEAGADDANELILLRCVIVDVDGRAAKQMNLLLPARRALRLTVPDAGQLVGRPLRVTVSATREWAGVDLRVDADTTGSVGLVGRAQVGADAVEIGQFRLSGHKMRVFLQVMTLCRTLG